MQLQTPHRQGTLRSTVPICNLRPTALQEWGDSTSGLWPLDDTRRHESMKGVVCSSFYVVCTDYIHTQYTHTTRSGYTSVI